jgi:hypothetical protein
MFRFRLRFSVRTLAIFITLVCAYFGAWEVTKTWGLPTEWPYRDPSTDTNVWIASSPVPFVVRYELKFSPHLPDRSHYYLWLFGPQVKLPFESNVKPRLIETDPD